jgi:hypothetical protein
MSGLTARTRPVALSMKQPWAFAVLHLGKSVENRKWRSSFRGRVVIHASRTTDDDGMDYIRAAGFALPTRLPTGAYIGEVTISDCVPQSECRSPWAFGPWCYLLEEPVSYAEPIPARGWLGFYPVPEDVAGLLNGGP